MQPALPGPGAACQFSVPSPSSVLWALQHPGLICVFVHLGPATALASPRAVCAQVSVK